MKKLQGLLLGCIAVLSVRSGLAFGSPNNRVYEEKISYQYQFAEVGETEQDSFFIFKVSAALALSEHSSQLYGHVYQCETRFVYPQRGHNGRFSAFFPALGIWKREFRQRLTQLGLDQNRSLTLDLETAIAQSRSEPALVFADLRNWTFELAIFLDGPPFWFMLNPVTVSSWSGAELDIGLAQELSERAQCRYEDLITFTQWLGNGSILRRLREHQRHLLPS